MQDVSFCIYFIYADRWRFSSRAGGKLKSIRYNTQYTVFENKLFIVIFCIGAFFGIGAYGVDKMELVAIIITAIVAFVVGFVVLYYIGKHRAE